MSDCQAQPGAGACARRCAAHEALEDMWQELRLDTGSGIVDAEHDLLVADLDHDRDRRVAWSELDRIVEQDQQDLLDSISVAGYRDVWQFVELDGAIRIEQPGRAPDLLDDRPQHHGLSG